MRIILAPMEGLVDAPIRETLTKVGGIDRCVTEFIRVTHGMLPPRIFYKYAPELYNGALTEVGTPVAVQLLGSNADMMGRHGAKAAELGAGQVDINFGCPAKTVNKHKGGCVLMREPELMYEITAAVRKAVPAHIPVTAKMRLGYDDRSMGVACGQALDAAGASEIVIHARSKVDGYKPPAYWEEIAKVREAVKSHVIANGEIWTVEDYWRCRKVSGCDDVMIGRGLIARPDLAAQIKASQNGEVLEPMSWAEAVVLVREYAAALQTRLEDKYVTGRIKQWLNYLRQGFAEAEALWPQARKIREVAPMLACLDQPVDLPQRSTNAA
ncbi:MAG TPA: tRNA dihydrouridine(16) synthase DusC [Marinobacter hydrocarbonoclasticus]|jgi:tRNA-dihydrouridine synthase C|uniref:tRNA dihydrouridine synthase n=1 Tax=unclassified Marinobacter TaxID=83889 RepID=UPI000C5D5D48|nr:MULTISPECIES: tRNA-dihydrouridine synthase [unclassified Marinobacter]MAC21985.1 tRNA dihydrouridine(16) synthase DusC [Marinobacter sp.]MBH92851.1 tRNA dihydrouridine(16) synthase DusC [Marinobacter sp.]MEC9038498.1 tRNA-dihydrouridine synthase [Pseudomonadota bacterium]HCR44797.1 tRNA dihydrouridine(16) synthase DusC [Marinobacter nauticus]|tara:strand:+ start:3155 stop:4132 length:978 start_codon:yes stop_codon:yes gene_type:complete